jgi:hypothetical protein
MKMNMAEECMDNFYLPSGPRDYRRPKDNKKYFIPLKAVRDTERILLQYARKKTANEGLVYWGGIEQGNIATVKAVIAPRTKSGPGGVFTSHRANFDFVRALNARHLIQIAQVHSHPGDWVEHSSGNNVLAVFKVKGLLSVVVPRYCQKGMIPLTICGIYRYEKRGFVKLSRTYVLGHFEVKSDISSYLEDFRK